MICKYCDLQLGLVIHIDAKTTCENCGNVNIASTIGSNYIGKNNENIHCFNIIEFQCIECDCKINQLKTPCGENYYFNFDKK